MSGKKVKRVRRIVKSQAETIKRNLINEMLDQPLKARIRLAFAILFKRRPR